MNGYQLNSRLNEQIDFKKIDEIASSNPMAKERQLSEMKNLLNNAASLIGGFNSSKTDAICSQLQIDGFGASDCKEVFKLMVDRFDKFPSYREIKALFRQVAAPIDAKPYSDPQSEKDYKKYKALKNMFLTKFTQEQLDKFVQWWLKETQGIDLKTVVNMGFRSELWEMPVLFDWHDTFYQFDLERIKLTTSKKTSYIEQQNKNNLLKMPTEFNKSTDYLKYSEV